LKKRGYAAEEWGRKVWSAVLQHRFKCGLFKGHGWWRIREDRARRRKAEGGKQEAGSRKQETGG